MALFPPLPTDHNMTKRRGGACLIKSLKLIIPKSGFLIDLLAFKQLIKTRKLLDNNHKIHSEWINQKQEKKWLPLKQSKGTKNSTAYYVKYILNSRKASPSSFLLSSLFTNLRFKKLCTSWWFIMIVLIPLRGGKPMKWTSSLLNLSMHLL